MQATRARLCDLEEEGFLVLPRPAALDSTVLASLAEGVRAVQAAGLPPVFALVYDEAWQVPITLPTFERLNIRLELHYFVSRSVFLVSDPASWSSNGLLYSGG